jgi:hypothetical protein
MITGYVFAASATATIDAENEFTTGRTFKGLFNIELTGSGTGTFTLQKSRDNSTWYDVTEITKTSDPYFAKEVEPEAGVFYRIGVKTGDTVAGSTAARLSN